MTRSQSPSRAYIAFLFVLSAVLVLGIVQWSFLPLLLQSGPGTTGSVLEFSPSHTSKFAAPFKALSADRWIPCLVPASITLPETARIAVRVPNVRDSGYVDFHLTHRAPRAPPSA